MTGPSNPDPLCAPGEVGGSRTPERSFCSRCGIPMASPGAEGTLDNLLPNSNGGTPT